MPPRRGRPARRATGPEPPPSPRRTRRNNRGPPPPPPPPGGGGGNANNAELDRMFNERLTAALPQIVAQLHQLMQTGPRPVPENTGENSGPTGGNEETPNGNSNPDPNGRGCNYKYFASCNPPDFYGTEGAAGLIRWIHGMETKLKISRCLPAHMVQYAACSLKGAAQTWWKTQEQTLTTAVVDSMPWSEFRNLVYSEYCPRNEIQKLKEELAGHKMVGSNLQKYTERFHELCTLLPTLFATEEDKIDQFVKGLNLTIRADVTARGYPTLKETISLAARLVDEAVSGGRLSKTNASGTTRTAGTAAAITTGHEISRK